MQAGTDSWVLALRNLLCLGMDMIQALPSVRTGFPQLSQLTNTLQSTGWEREHAHLKGWNFLPKYCSTTERNLGTPHSCTRYFMRACMPRRT